MTKLEWVADRLRHKDAELRKTTVLGWRQIQSSEQERWREMARVAIKEAA